MVLLVHTAATLFMTGLIWFVQIVHYPLFSMVGRNEFQEYERLHQMQTTWVVGPAMLIELLTGLWLLKSPPAGSQFAAWMGLLLIVIIWLTTAGLSVPAHNRLAEEFSDTAYRKLVSTNWIRTIAWSARAVLVLWIVQNSCVTEALS